MYLKSAKTLLFAFMGLFLVACGDHNLSDDFDLELYSQNIILNGVDTRERITSPIGVESYVGVVEAKFEGAQSFIRCTATLIAEDYLLTSAHCLLNQNLAQLEFLRFRPQVLGPNSRHRVYELDAAWVPQKFVELLEEGRVPVSKLGRYDIGIAKFQSRRFSRSPGVRYGYAQIGPTDLNKPSFEAYVVGYPRDKDLFTLWRSECQVTALSENTMRTPCDLLLGQSGAPVIDISGEQEIVRGVFSFASALLAMNYSTQISSDFYHDIHRILAGKKTLKKFKPIY